MKLLLITGGVLCCMLAAIPSASGATLGTQLNVYADSYAPVKSRTITITAQFADVNGLPVNDTNTPFTPITVNWSVSNGAYGITASSSTNALGYATATLTVPASAGQITTVTATGGGYTATTNTITSITAAGAATKYVVTLANHEPTLSTGVGVTAQLADADNNPVGTSGRTVTWSKTGLNGSFGTATSSTNGSGVATVTFTAGAAMTTYVISGNDGTFSGSALPATTCEVAPTGSDVLTTPVPYFLDYARIQFIFSSKCTGCHDTVGNGGNGQTPLYTVGSSYTNIFNMNSSYGLKFVTTTSDAANSMIYRKTHQPSPFDGLGGGAGSGGGRMPATGVDLNPAEQQIIRDWINQGAVNRSVSTAFQMSVDTTSPTAGGPVTISAQLRDSTNAAIKVPGMKVNWTKTGTNGSFASASTRTDANGIASVVFTTDTVSGRSYTFTATSNSITGTTGTVTSVPGPAAAYTLGLSTNNPVAGNPVTISAQVVDQFGNNVSQVRTITWSHSNAGSGASFSSPTSTTSGAGAASVTFFSSTTAPLTETVTATDAPCTTTSAAITTKSAQYLVTATPAPPYALGQTINVKAQLADGGGTPILLAGQNVSFTSTDLSGVFTPSTAQLTNASGIVNVTYKFSNTSGMYNIVATDGVANGTLAVTSNPGPASAYIVTVSSVSPTVNTPITADAQLVDAFNNVVPTSGLTVTWTTTGKGGTFVTSPTFTDGTGHTSLSFTPSTSAGLTTINVSDTLHVGSKNITSVAGAATKYIVTAASSMTVGSAGNAVTAQLADTFGNPVSLLRTVTWGASGVGGSFTSPTSNTNGAGLASVNFTASTTAGSPALSATDGTLSGNTSTITVNPGPANKYIVTSSTSSPIAGSGVTINAQLTDSFGNALTTSGLTVGWSLTAGVGGGFSSPTSNTVSGVATVVFTTSNVAGTLYTAKATEGAHAGSVSFTSIAGTPTQCPLVVAPTNPVAGSAVSVTGQLKDVNGNNVAQAGIVIIWSSDASGAFAQGTSTSNASGQVSVNFTTGPKANVTYNLTATDGLAINGSAAPFTSRTGTAAAYTVSVSNTAPVAGSAITATAQLVDLNGNAVATAGQTVTWTQTGTLGTFASPTSLTNSSGVATISLTTNTVAATSGTITATTGANTGVSPTITTLNGAAAKYIVTASSTSVSAGTAVRIAAQLVDANGNAVTTAGTTVTWSMTGPNGFFSTPTSDTSSSGMATVVLSTSPSGSVSYVVSAADAAGLKGTGPSITVAAAPPVTGVSPLITSPLTATTAVGAPFTYAITATGDPTIVFNATNLPVGLTLSGDTITGATFGSGTFVVHVTASNAFGTDAIDLVIVSSPLQAISVDRLGVKLNFTSATTATDALGAMFTLTLPDGTSVQNATAVVQIGGLTFANKTSAALKARGKKGTAGPSAIVTIKPAVKGSTSLFVTLAVKSFNLKDGLAGNGLINATLAATVQVPVVVTLNTDSGTFYCGGTVALKYKATKGKSGSAAK